MMSMINREAAVDSHTKKKIVILAIVAVYFGRLIVSDYVGLALCCVVYHNIFTNTVHHIHLPSFETSPFLMPMP